ncbi:MULTISPECIES: hypothetical protein [unclassified Achromobacter]|uniref:hypothetical protein n=1 Tax=unclassified Achromobacter TaxID=2626865 RepID=UPI000B51C7EA|nr:MULTISPECIES: hypothetical protein [unclassified Achromobacter]OWT68080.1 hypothetical protein CEY05_29030 [Achromobacter sp. HZ34]OWT69917.1 hypothetical protein CEY04_27860 [Achromobacter sp. HZ28]
MTDKISKIADPAGIFSKQQQASSAQTAIVQPPPDTTTASTSKNVQEQEDLLRQRQGRAANLLTGSSGINNTPVGTKTLLGS